MFEAQGAQGEGGAEQEPHCSGFGQTDFLPLSILEESRDLEQRPRTTVPI